MYSKDGISSILAELKDIRNQLDRSIGVEVPTPSGISGAVSTHAALTTGIHGLLATDHVALTAQSASIGSTNLTNGSVAGTYRLNYYLESTTLNIGATSIMVTVAYTDDAGATTLSSIALPLTALGRTQGIFYVRLASGSISYSTTLIDATGLARYALYMDLERLS